MMKKMSGRSWNCRFSIAEIRQILDPLAADVVAERRHPIP